MPKKQYENLSDEDRYKYHRNHWLSKKYGITLAIYEQMYKDQDGVCDICKQPETRVSATGKHIVLSVDHNHITGEVRGLLCYKCNVMLGSAKESSDILMSAVDYLMRHS